MTAISFERDGAKREAFGPIRTQVDGRNEVFAVYNDREETVKFGCTKQHTKCTKALDLNKFEKRFAEQDGNRRIQL